MFSNARFLIWRITEITAARIYPVFQSTKYTEAEIIPHDQLAAAVLQSANSEALAPAIDYLYQIETNQELELLAVQQIGLQLADANRSQTTRTPSSRGSNVDDPLMDRQ
jgi:hypothetical protein